MFCTVTKLMKFENPLRLICRLAVYHGRFFSQKLENKYNDTQKEKIVRVINESDTDTLSEYDITKARLNKIAQWKTSNGEIKCVSDLELIEGFTHKTADKLFKSILEGPQKKVLSNKIKGQFLQPNLSEAIRKNTNTVLSVFISVNSVCWTLIDKTNYEVVKWEYRGIDYPDGRRFQITDILDIAWKITKSLPMADIYVVPAEATTLRAAGSDPNNPKVIAVNLQKAQMVAMIVALINARGQDLRITDGSEDSRNNLKQTVYFLRSTLPYRLYGTLVGTEKVSTDQLVDMLLQKSTEISKDNSNVYVPENLQSMFRSQKDLQKDMLGHSLLLGLTFMDLCIYKNQESINRLLSKRME